MLIKILVIVLFSGSFQENTAWYFKDKKPSSRIKRDDLPCNINENHFEKAGGDENRARNGIKFKFWQLSTSKIYVNQQILIRN